MLATDQDTLQRDLVEVGRKYTRKVYNNVRGVVGEDVFSVLSPYKNAFTVGIPATGRRGYPKQQACLPKAGNECVPIWEKIKITQ